mmetsp:Transcript_18141/g.55563  ORF Transcript_18141/g.55563 Transcript_18141/m.55563 type:complete len:668 (-) Transcript_18141:1805-3808(-)
MADSLVANRFRTHRRLGSGSFGEIFVGVDQSTGLKVAMKFERQNLRCPQLRHEFKVYRELKGCKGICNVSHYGVHVTYNVMVLELLGPSLEELFTRCGRKFSLRTTLKLADQMLERVDTLHARHLIHRDVKPANFVMGDAASSSMVYCIDFGLSKRYRNPHTLQHISYRTGKSLTGTPRYASISNHQGIEQSRRDDLEAVGYVLVYFLRGRLPWQGLKAKSAHRKYKLILEKKQEISIAALCAGCPPEFAEYLSYCRCLGFEKDPDMPYLRGLFRHLYKAQGYDVNDLHASDWDWSPKTASASAKNPSSNETQGASSESNNGGLLSRSRVGGAPGQQQQPGAPPQSSARHHHAAPTTTTTTNGVVKIGTAAVVPPQFLAAPSSAGVRVVNHTTTTQGPYASQHIKKHTLPTPESSPEPKRQQQPVVLTTTARAAIHNATTAQQQQHRAGSPAGAGGGSLSAAPSSARAAVPNSASPSRGAAGSPQAGSRAVASSSNPSSRMDYQNGRPRTAASQQQPQGYAKPADRRPSAKRAVPESFGDNRARRPAPDAIRRTQEAAQPQRGATRDPFTRAGADRYELRRPRSAINYKDSSTTRWATDKPAPQAFARSSSTRSATRNNAAPVAASSRALEGQPQHRSVVASTRAVVAVARSTAQQQPRTTRRGASG